MAPETLALPKSIGYPIGATALVIAIVWFIIWKVKYSNTKVHSNELK